ncbi:hypothetical protein Vqi01_43750 [Micromonospora qiuiae]|uniref:2OG-Fe dioxygenase family protein n=1 Tax=Micromonospora qiuiae TaxID=502268 RepID=A0ABQ4JFR2_9ACTN|nr:2OG-Fe dioxygenase family protein [Micromonospora qiuiae]GIJ29213.1 hypothetical protein Vqi01_43750 [Micromonospora qiuiae]
MTDMDLDEALAEIAQIKERYVRDRAAFVRGEHLIRILSAFGSTPESVAAFQRVTEGLPPDPTLAFRKARNGRFCLDVAAGRAYRTEFQPFVLTADEDFVRHDSGKVRHFAEINDETQQNPTFQALLIFKMLVVNDVEIVHRPGLDYDADRWICTAFHTRTITTQELTGEPALEGVHSDGVDHTMTILLGSENMSEESAVTQIHDMREKNATRWSDVNPELAIGRWQHRHFLDSILIVDHERKHSVSTIEQRDVSVPARRDMLVLFTRRAAVEGHVSYAYDSIAPHETLPMEVKLLVPTHG